MIFSKLRDELRGFRRVLGILELEIAHQSNRGLQMIGRSIKIGILVVLGIVSSLVTSTILGQVRSTTNTTTSKPGANPIAPSELVSTSEEVSVDAARRAAQLSDGNGFRLKKMDVVVNGQDATVTAIVGMMSQSRASLLWSVVVRDNVTNVSNHHMYDNQIFSVKDKGYVEPTFKDVFPLKPGSYRIEVRLYRVGPNPDLNKLKTDNDFAYANMVIKYFKDVTVSN